MFVKKGDAFLVSISLKELEDAYSAEKNAKAKLRLQCAILRKKGKSQPFIAEVTGTPVTTVSDILRRFETRGVSGSHAIKQQGQPPKLSQIQRAKLKRVVSKSPTKEGLPFKIWTTKLVQHIIYKMFNVEYVVMQVHRLLKSMGLSLQKARPEHIKANKQLQADFKKNFDEELQSLGNMDMRSYFWTKQRSNSNH
jgi:transposase